jgi:polysaccharide deacetylase 2 family uncharacterized protein YibQ
MPTRAAFGTAFILYLLSAAPLPAADPPRVAYIALIIDDLGNNPVTDTRTARLPGPVACAVLPHTAYAVDIANAAFGMNKEVLLHLPMESLDAHEPGPGTLDSSMFEREFAKMLDYDLASVPHVVGINNHMGSRLTADAGFMTELMREIHRRPALFFIDSRTNPESVAASTARITGVPALSRDVFLDNEPNAAAIELQMKTLIRLARKNGAAIGIGHPHPATLAVLEQWLPRLAEQHIRLIPLSRMLELPHPEAAPWQASLSR